MRSRPTPAGAAGLALWIIAACVGGAVCVAGPAGSDAVVLVLLVCGLGLWTTALARRSPTRPEPVDWVLKRASTLAEATSAALVRYPHPGLEEVVLHRFGQLTTATEDLGRGIVRFRADADIITARVSACRSSLCAVTNISGDTGWWQEPLGERYWQANLDALARGVRITRVFVYDRMSLKIAELVSKHRAAGVEVHQVQVNRLDKELRVNFAVFDESTAWEAQMTPQGLIATSIVRFHPGDVARLLDFFHRAVRQCEP
ncbi:hypothetical protein ACIGNX_27350 [Actinosynnema sp. NPDC053489]|uniref:hypothetical protein n=1 Tax=Actinosynnema sp. NPDC053489 TaxID=3363916 RepID=UPI0037C9FEFB